MAIVDLNNGKIYGCKENSMVWKHEMGHIAFNNSYFGVKISYYHSFFLMIAVFVTSIAILIDTLLIKVTAFIISLSVIVFYILEESWCWGYAFKSPIINKITNVESNIETKGQ